MPIKRAPLTWADDIVTGDVDLDDQHREFYTRAQKIVAASKAGQDIGELAVNLEFLANYAEQHFAREEQLMAEIKYAYAETHKAAHRSFRNKLAEFLNTPYTILTVREVAEWTSDWFMRHERMVDRPFIEALHSARKDAVSD
ncbi:MAG: hypothetical protein A2289_15170 [Deltaproteobacteria bacterium RIFOXYA12_FULL_58_15]|nr:MAG: hypothetical protein A2289_15170 [Deltaproteobacteria bacterium RIFOXYA12_FULL_58_15]